MTDNNNNNEFMSQTHKRYASAISIIVLAIILVITFAIVTDNSYKNEISENIATHLDMYVNPDENTIAIISDEIGNISQTVDLPNNQLVTKMLNGFNYQIDSIDKNENTVKATITVVSRKTSTLSDILNSDIEKLKTDTDTLVSLSQEELTEKYKETVLQAFDKLPLTAETLTLTYVKYNGKWELDDESIKIVNNILVR